MKKKISKLIFVLCFHVAYSEGTFSKLINSKKKEEKENRENMLAAVMNIHIFHFS